MSTSTSGAPANVTDIHETASAMPHVTQEQTSGKNSVYQVGRKSFVFFRTPRPDAIDPETGQRYDDVIVLWVTDEGVKESLVRDPESPFFTTSHFDGHLSVLIRASRLAEVTREEIVELVQDAWLAQASPRRARDWLRSQGLDPD